MIPYHVTAYAASRPLNILLVEDEPLLAMDLEDIVADLGCTVAGVESTAAGALDVVRHVPVDLALVDFDIRGPVDGIGAARAILADRGVRSVFVTGHASDLAFRERASVANPLGFVAKPYRACDIGRAIAGANL